MKKLYLLSFVCMFVSIVLCSCEKNKEIAESKDTPKEIKMTFSCTSPQNKLKVSTGTDGETLLWSAGDAIRVYSPSHPEAAICNIIRGAGTNYGVFACEEAFEGPYYAVFDGQNREGYDTPLFEYYGVYGEEYKHMGVFSIETQYTEGFSAPIQQYCVFAQSNTTDLTFEHTFGYLRLKFRGTEKIKKITVIANKQGELIGGALVLNLETFEVIESELSGIALTFYFDTPITLSPDKDAEFLVPLLPGAFSEGFTMRILNDRQEFYILNSSKDNKNMIQKGKAVTMPTVTLTPDMFSAKYVTDKCGNNIRYIEDKHYIWMTENYRCTQYDTESDAYKKGIYTIPSAPASGDSYNPYYMDPKNDVSSYSGKLSTEDREKLGYLYNYAAVYGLSNKTEVSSHSYGNQWEEIQGICPNGWHILNSGATNNAYCYYPSYKSGLVYKSSKGWYNDGNGTGEAMIDIYPAGYYSDASATNSSIGGYAYLWVTGNWGKTTEKANAYRLKYNAVGDDSPSLYLTSALSVRCIADWQKFK